ncbi:uncharacterized protein TNCV_374691 [Trichonephila clavipes]|nr:uncharacterized protein TNCV_374691 [Trichonephila clavipes]
MVKCRGRHLSWHPPLLTTTPHQREDVSALDRFNVHRCPTRRVFSGTGLEPVTKQATVRYLYHSATAATNDPVTLDPTLADSMAPIPANSVLPVSEDPVIPIPEDPDELIALYPFSLQEIREGGVPDLDYIDSKNSKKRFIYKQKCFKI